MVLELIMIFIKIPLIMSKVQREIGHLILFNINYQLFISYQFLFIYSKIFFSF